MLTAAHILIAVVLAIHIAIVLLETVLFHTYGRKVFGLTKAQAGILAPAMSNQGCYNGFLAAALITGFVHGNAAVAHAFFAFGLACVAVAGLWGALTVNKRIFFVQTVPAALALIALASS